MPTVSVNDTTLHVEEDGAGPPLVVVHGGLGVDHQLSRRTLASLADTFRLVFYDQRATAAPPRSTWPR